MLETTLVLGAVGSVGFVVLLATVFTAPVMIMLALGALLLGLVVGVPTGFWYHVVLYRIGAVDRNALEVFKTRMGLRFDAGPEV